MEEEKNGFAKNGRISARQVKYLMTLKWIAVLGVLLPVCLEGKTMGSLIFCVVLGAVLWSAVIRIILSFAGPGQDFFDAVSRVAGTGLAVICYAAGLLFFLAQAAVFLNLSAEMCRLYLLPEVPVPILCLLPLAAGVYLSRGSVEVRGRFCEAFGPAVLGLLVLLLFLAAFGMRAYPYEETTVRLSDQLLGGGLEVFACLGGVFLPVLGIHFAGRQGTDSRTQDGTRISGSGRSGEQAGSAYSGRSIEKDGDVCSRAADVPENAAHRQKKGASEFGRAVFRAFLTAVTFAGCLCAVTVGSYGKNGMMSIDFPSVRVMSNVKVPGSFLQRWDIFFFALLLVCMVVTLADALWYVQEIMTKLWMEGTAACVRRKKEIPEDRNRLYRRISWSWGAGVVLVYGAAAGFLSSFTAICYYRALNLQLLVPLMVFFYIITASQKIRKRQEVSGDSSFELSRKRRAVILSRTAVLVLLLVVSAVFLGGCTAREPEERLFPMALEIGAEDGELVLTCAWNEGAGPGGSAGGTEADSGQKTDNGQKAGAGEASTDNNLLTVFRGASLESIREQTVNFTEKYVDYSHVKAVILDESLKTVPGQAAEVMEWFAREPAFASGLIVYPAQKSGLTLEKAASGSSGKIGSYLEGLYKNNEWYRETSTTLGTVIAEYYRQKTPGRYAIG